MQNGERFGRLVFLGKRERGVKSPKGLFLCECGTEKWIQLSAAKSGRSKSCGCSKRMKPGEVYGRLTFTGERTAGRHARGLFRCDCGTEKWIELANVRSGNTRSCGCLSRELKVARSTILVDGLPSAEHPLYRTYHNMLNRCYNPNVRNFSDYGGRGIKVCPEWQGPEGFANFVKDMGECPEGFSIDRTENSGHYEPGNCRWRSFIDQQNNKRSNRLLEIHGRTQTVAEWAREVGLELSTVFSRLYRGWPPEDAVFTPVLGPVRTPASSQRG